MAEFSSPAPCGTLLGCAHLDLDGSQDSGAGSATSCTRSRRRSSSVFLRVLSGRSGDKCQQDVTNCWQGGGNISEVRAKKPRYAWHCPCRDGATIDLLPEGHVFAVK